MSQTLFDAIDRYIREHLLAAESDLDNALQKSTAAGLPEINVAPNQGKLLYVLARAMGVKKVLEIGTLAGYSTIWLARALAPDGRVITLELDPKHADVARENVSNAGVGTLIDIRVGAALETLPRLEAEGVGPFCLTFIDADKVNIPSYFEWAVKLSRPGSLIVVDNVVRQGALVNEHSTDPDVIGVRRLHELIRNDPRVSATTIQTVGSKGHDGLTFAVVN
ncbi:MAG: O-methyltransferase [Xanthomonadaceae bacterium]|nr:O-methyltransferase [Xanthomonadaceae bacterium]